MDITPTTTISNNNNTPSATTKSPEHDTETPTRITTPTMTKTLSFSNGVLKRHPHHHHPPISTAITYKECLKNHAANLGGHALDGCGEFMPSPTATVADPSSIKCAACGCHRNFHRREPEEPPIASTTHVIEYQPHHRHHPPPPFPTAVASTRSPNSASPPPISSSYYPSAPHMLLALSAGLAAPPESTAAPSATLTRKRFRTKFSQEQKEKMHKFAEKVGWKMQKRDDDLIHDFCNEVGVDRSVLKVWMHNNKNTFAKKDTTNNIHNINNVTSNINDNDANGGDKGFEDPNTKDGGEDRGEDLSRNHFGGPNVGANGSSSTS
ncbi:hypothetical protein VNO78_15032 [Psophocarpus tetragonolobus]|uniref:ZF-HD dimerization-type domain-containing protein n=1 Tax=Psophocarpus tetragonolobus TaxID=3891 RepID=A0AAN9SDA3_PSOTE